jgi:hypothetical protein
VSTGTVTLRAGAFAGGINAGTVRGVLRWAWWDFAAFVACDDEVLVELDELEPPQPARANSAASTATNANRWCFEGTGQG